MNTQPLPDRIAATGHEWTPFPESHTPSSAPESTADTLVLREVSSLSGAEYAALERLAFEHGQSPDAYLAVERDRHCFLTPDHSAAMSVVVSGRYLHISGGILAPLSARPQWIVQLGEYARRTNSLIACYSIGEQDRRLFEDADWEVSKFGEDSTLRLGTLNWSGKAYEWVRRQFNSCQRAGLTCYEASLRKLDPVSWKTLTDELFEIQREDLRDRIYPREINLLVGKLQPEEFGRRRLFIVEQSAKSRIEAFVVANPMRGGTGWALELFRKRPDAPRGTVPYLFKWIIDVLKVEGVDEVSLCLLLWKGSHTFSGRRTSPLLRWGLVLGYHLGNFLYNTKGMTLFKTRFRPVLTNCYVCVTPKTPVFSCINFFHVVGAFSLSPRNFVRSIWKSLTRRVVGPTATVRGSD